MSQIKPRFNKGQLVNIDFYTRENGETLGLIVDVEKGSRVESFKYSFIDRRGNVRWWEEGMGWNNWRITGSSWRNCEPYNFKVEEN
jgi:hypothetical protein